MRKFDLSLSLPASIASLTPMLGLRPVARILYVRAIRLISGDNTQTTPGLLTPANATLVTSTGTAYQGPNRDPSGAAMAGFVDLAWSVAPTLPGAPVWQRAEPLASGIGNGNIWDFTDEPLVIPVGGYLALFNAGASPSGALTVSLSLGE